MKAVVIPEPTLPIINGVIVIKADKDTILDRTPSTLYCLDKLQEIPKLATKPISPKLLLTPLYK